MTSSERPPRSRTKSPRDLRVVETLPPGVTVAVFPGQGQHLFQLFRDDLMRAFAAPPSAPSRESNHG